MKPVPEHAKQILTATDQQLRQLIAEAATAGDLAGVDFAREIDGRVRQILHSISSTGFKTGELSAPRNPPPPRVSRSKAARKGAPKRKTGYPKYSSRSGILYRLGWSKKQREEYEHKAPRRVVELFAASLVKKSGNGSLVTVDDVMPLVDPGDGSDLPTYQAYLCLAWLRGLGLVKQQGRQGYIVPEPGSLQSLLEEEWTQLPTR